MARTLSPASQFAIALSVILGLALFDDRALAEPLRKSPASSNDPKSSVKVKPIAPLSPPVAAAPEPIAPPTRKATGEQDPRSAHPVATSFRNPFSTESGSTHAEATLLPGPRSRWHISRSPLNALHGSQSPTLSDTTITASTDTPASAPSVLQLNPPLSNAAPEAATTPLADTSSPEVVIITDEPELAPTTNPFAATDTLSRASALEATTPTPANVSVKSAVLTADPRGPVVVDRLASQPQFPLLNDDPDASTAPIAPSSVLDPHDSTRYAMDHSNPSSSEPDTRQQGTSLSIVQPLNLSPQRSALPTQARRPSSVVAQTAFEQSQPEVRSTNSTTAITPIAEDEAVAEPATISEHDDSASNWLVEAQEAARTAQTLEDLAGVIQLCERVTSADPRNKLVPFARKLAAWAHNRRGELHVDSDQQSDALAEFQAAIENDPKNSLAIHNRAVTLAQQSDYDAALIDFNRVIELNPGLAVAYRNRAELLAAQGKADDAIADYTRAIEAMPDDAELYRARAHALQQLDQYEHALQDLDRSVQIAPDEAQGYAQRGNLLADRGDFGRALDDLKQALTVDPQLIEAHRSVAWIKATCPDERLRDAFEALAAARTAAKLSSPNDYLALEVLAAAHANAGEFDKAMTAQQQAIDAAPSDVAPSMRARLDLYEHRRPYRVGR